MNIDANMGGVGTLTASQSGGTLTPDMGNVGTGNVVSNGKFETDSDWSKGAGWTITGGKAVGTAATSNLRQSGILTIGVTYTVTFEVSDYASGSFLAACGSNTGALIDGDGSYSESILCAGNTDFFFNGVVAFNGKIDNVTAIPQ